LILPGPQTLLYSALIVSVILIAIIIFKPSVTATQGGKMFAFVALFILPILGTLGAASDHIERSKRTTFCLSCHIMEPYGKSLLVDDPLYIPAAHFQNHRIPADEACYTCHTNYGLYGDIHAKLGGLRHIYIQYLGTPPAPDKITLFTPYNNRECLHCHLGARSFESNEVHKAIMDSLKSNEMSCVTSGCHDMVHNIDSLTKAKYWSPANESN
jgi:nitrate/TMAO reductase-like tetraheme cytochrome c subunit